MRRYSPSKIKDENKIILFYDSAFVKTFRIRKRVGVGVSDVIVKFTSKIQCSKPKPTFETLIFELTEEEIMEHVIKETI